MGSGLRGNDERMPAPKILVFAGSIRSGSFNARLAEAAISLKHMMMRHQGIFIASPEYNASITPLLKNSLDWVSRVREGKEAPLAAYKDRAFAISGASNGNYG